jgi:hypothetical protein
MSVQHPTKQFENPTYLILDMGRHSEVGLRKCYQRALRRMHAQLRVIGITSLGITLDVIEG